jgi:hypothetical protein
MPLKAALFMKFILFGLKVMCKTWRQGIEIFKDVVLFLLTAFALDIAVVAVSYGRVGALWRPEVLMSLATVAFFYIFMVPLVMQIEYERLLKKLKRGQSAELVLIRAMPYPLMTFISAHVLFSAVVKATIATACPETNGSPRQGLWAGFS